LFLLLVLNQSVLFVLEAVVEVVVDQEELVEVV
jgi:hypothetical protein